MIIFGTRSRIKTLSEGSFYCPQCRAKRTYEHKEARRYFTLYFIPLIPLDSLGDFVECDFCHGTFKPEVLNMKAPERVMTLAELVNNIPGLLKEGMAMEILVQALTQAGLTREVALQNVESQMKAGQVHCETCGLTYLAGVATCKSCGKNLTPATTS